MPGRLSYWAGAAGGKHLIRNVSPTFTGRNITAKNLRLGRWTVLDADTTAWYTVNERAKYWTGVFDTEFSASEMVSSMNSSRSKSWSSGVQAPGMYYWMDQFDNDWAFEDGVEWIVPIDPYFDEYYGVKNVCRRFTIPASLQSETVDAVAVTLWSFGDAKAQMRMNPYWVGDVFEHGWYDYELNPRSSSGVYLDLYLNGSLPSTPGSVGYDARVSADASTSNLVSNSVPLNLGGYYPFFDDYNLVAPYDVDVTSTRTKALVSGQYIYLIMNPYTTTSYPLTGTLATWPTSLPSPTHAAVQGFFNQKTARYTQNMSVWYAPQLWIYSR